MPTAICEDCKEVYHYRGTRGFRLKEVMCKCGGRYRKARWSHWDEKTGKPVYVPMEYKGQSGKMVSCVLCGARRKMGQSRVRVLDKPKEFKVITYMQSQFKGMSLVKVGAVPTGAIKIPANGILDNKGKKSIVTVKPGEPICAFHLYDPEIWVIKHVEA